MAVFVEEEDRLELPPRIVSRAVSMELESVEVALTVLEELICYPKKPKAVLVLEVLVVLLLPLLEVEFDASVRISCILPVLPILSASNRVVRERHLDSHDEVIRRRND